MLREKVMFSSPSEDLPLPGLPRQFLVPTVYPTSAAAKVLFPNVSPFVFFLGLRFPLPIVFRQLRSHQSIGLSPHPMNPRG